MGDVDGQEPASADANFAANVRHYREQIGLSQEELAQRMSERGFGFTQATVWKIEQGKRAVRIGEAVGLVDALGLPFWMHMSLARDPNVFRLDAQVQAAHRRAAAAFDEIKTATAEFLRTQAEVAFAAHEAQEAGVAIHDVWTSWLQTPAERAVLEARVEWSRRDELGEQIDDAVDSIIAALRDKGYDPTISLDDVETTGGPWS